MTLMHLARMFVNPAGVARGFRDRCKRLPAEG
jgi:hypothetical protein